MGRTKAELRTGDETLLQRTVRILRGLTREVIVVGGPNLPKEAWARHFADRRPGMGPLGGLVTGLQQMEADWAFVCGCDMPSLDPGVVAHILELAAKSEADAVVPRIGGIPQVLHAAYRRQTVDKLEIRIAQQTSSRSLRGALAHLRVRWLAEAEITPFDPHFRSFIDIDSVDQWTRFMAEPNGTVRTAVR